MTLRVRLGMMRVGHKESIPVGYSVRVFRSLCWPGRIANRLRRAQSPAMSTQDPPSTREPQPQHRRPILLETGAPVDSSERVDTNDGVGSSWEDSGRSAEIAVGIASVVVAFLGVVAGVL